MTQEVDVTVERYRDRDVLVQKALDETPYHKLLGIPEDQVRLSPRWVRPVQRVPQVRDPGTPPSCEIQIDAKLQGDCLHSRTWDTSQRDQHEVGIWLADLEFPEYCCVCMAPMTHYELMEITYDEVKATEQWAERRVGDQWKNAGRDEWIQRLKTAVQQKRSWLTVTFCDQHDADSAPIRYAQTSSSCLRLPNREYSQLFAEKNNLRGNWVTRRTATAGMIALLLFAASGVFFLFEFLQYINQKTTVHRPVIALALVLLAVSLLIGMKWGRGEPLSTNQPAA